MIKKVRILAAILFSKAVLLLSRVAGNQGSVLPGRLALIIYPAILKELAKGIEKHTIIITGTNGKTTTANILAHILKTAPYTLINNSSGANMMAGITTAFIDGASWYGGGKYDYAVLETDEANVAPLLKEIKADYLLITNFFNDQSDRFGDLNRIVALIQDAARGKDLELFLNADDPLISSFVEYTGCKAYYFGFEDNKYDQTSSREKQAGNYCAFCGSLLIYEKFRYAQLGKYKCPNCKSQNPQADFSVSSLILEPRIKITVNGMEIQSSLRGYYNAYNLLAAVSVALHFQVSRDIIESSVKAFHTNAGRMEKFMVREKACLLTLIKNSAGFNQLLASLPFDNQDKTLIFFLNDSAADGRDISWIWDVEAENLTQKSYRVKSIICSGQRSGDMALRIKYSGWPLTKLQIAGTPYEALNLALKEKNHNIYLVCSYSALFKTRKMLLHDFSASAEKPNNNY